MSDDPDTAAGAQEAATAVGRAAEVLAGASALLVCAGAGMGVDSGLPDFRGDDGFWRAYPPYARIGLRFVELADPVHFATDPELAWGFYGHRLELYRATVPHPGFDVLKRMGQRLPGGVGVFTSNVDGQFQAAGFGDAGVANSGFAGGEVAGGGGAEVAELAEVAEVHGSLMHLQCVRPCGAGIWSAAATRVDVDPTTMRAVSPLPRCPDCGDLARPNVLMFGDGDWVSSRTDAAVDRLSDWLRPVLADVAVVEIGAGTAVPTVRRFAEAVSRTSGRLVRVNPREPEIRGGVGVSVSLGACAALTTLEGRLATRRDW